MVVEKVSTLLNSISSNHLTGRRISDIYSLGPKHESFGSFSWE